MLQLRQRGSSSAVAEHQEGPGEGDGNDILIFNDTYGVVICTRCGLVLTHVQNHLSTSHTELELSVRQALVSRYSRYEEVDIAALNNQIRQYGYSNPTQAVRGLAIVDGFACLYGDCRELSSNEQVMLTHLGQKHNRRRAAKKGLMTKVQMQSFFRRGRAKRYFVYFCVRPAPVGEEGDHDANTPRGADGSRTAPASDPHVNDEVVTETAHPMQGQETRNWFRRTGWVEHFDGRDLQALHAASMMPRSCENELRRMVRALDRLFLAMVTANVPGEASQLVVGASIDDVHDIPSAAMNDSTGMDRHLTLMQRFLCYCLRLLDLEQDALRTGYGLVLTQDQRDSLERFRELLRQDDDEGTERSPGSADSGLAQSVLGVLSGFWMQRVEGNPFASPLWHFTAVLGIDGDTGRLRPAHMFIHVLAGLSYVGRALLWEWCTVRCNELVLSDPTSLIGQVRIAAVGNNNHYPMGLVESLLGEAKSVLDEMDRRPQVSLADACGTVYIRGSPLFTDSIVRMVENLTAHTEGLLWDQLMFGKGSSDQDRLTIHLGELDDDLTAAGQGISFMTNNRPRRDAAYMLSELQSSWRKGELMEQDGGWRWAGVNNYLRTVEELEERMLVLCHLTGGKPCHGPEITSVRIVGGTHRSRDVFVVDGEVVIITPKYLSPAEFDSRDVMARFLPDRVGQLIAMYMAYIRPLKDHLKAEMVEVPGEVEATSEFMWDDGMGPWDISRMSTAMAKWTSQYLGDAVTLHDWRQIAVAIVEQDALEGGGKRRLRGQ
ncbi:hypothetical protein FPOAC2_10382 [Fusarium poae]